ncbi:uncharacterized protein LOC132557106 [Ylistrum balloti]|uniref:uncharacterized protein LOC132557106 n=1 Tax=Ylistrum balloti TaxID=509963 RepID=UPI002905B7FB|nr:uncharacterized protein LOC132557106 [Ylistrum balloti]
MLQPSKLATISTLLDLTPGVIDFGDKNRTVSVQLSNVTSRTLTIHPKAVICELQPVVMEKPPPSMEQKERLSILDILDFSSSKDVPLSPYQLSEGMELIKKYEDIFSKHDNDIGHSTMVQHRIRLEDETPFKQRHRRIPPSMLEEVKGHLQQLLSGGIIRKSHSPWTSNVVLVRKKDGSLRMCVDYRQMNNRTIKDSYALPRIEEILDCLSGNKFFTVLDMKSGYHQVEIDEPHKERTTFTVGPCRQRNAGIEADPDKIAKIRDWPEPSTPEDVRKFLGFAGYYRKFVPNFAHIARPLTDLLPPTHKKSAKSKKQEEVEWKWGTRERISFQNLKEALSSPPVLGFADYTKPFELHTDASSIGLGAVLYQDHDGTCRPVAYASRGLTKTEKNYPAHKLEFLAMKWAITDKFHVYLYGNHFTVYTDNNPLTYVLSKAKLDAAGHRW